LPAARAMSGQTSKPSRRGKDSPPDFIASASRKAWNLANRTALGDIEYIFVLRLGRGFGVLPPFGLERAESAGKGSYPFHK
jgi:hypothetical protein